MSLPEHRQAINGRTFDREWQPRAVEHHRRASSPIRDAARIFVCLVAAIVIGAILASGA